MSNKFAIKNFIPDVFKTDHEHAGKEVFFDIYAYLEGQPYEEAYEDYYGDWWTKEALYFKNYGFWCEYNATSDKLTLNEHPTNRGSYITKELYEEFKEQHLEKIRTKANKILHLTLVCPLCQKEHDAFHAQTIPTRVDEREYICDNLCKEYEDEFDVEYAYLVEKKQTV